VRDLCPAMKILLDLLDLGVFSWLGIERLKELGSFKVYFILATTNSINDL
jgi:hypothetical protein